MQPCLNYIPDRRVTARSSKGAWVGMGVGNDMGCDGVVGVFGPVGRVGRVVLVGMTWMGFDGRRYGWGLCVWGWIAI